MQILVESKTKEENQKENNLVLNSSEFERSAYQKKTSFLFFSCYITTLKLFLLIVSNRDLLKSV